MLLSTFQAILLVLCTVSSASPITETSARQLESRATMPAAVNCGNKKFTKTEIYASLQSAKSTVRGYPKNHLGIGKGGEKLFPDYKKKMWEQPLMNPVWSTARAAQLGGRPGAYRVVMDDGYKYLGAVYHPDLNSNTFEKCVNVAA